ncbi:MAG: folate-binding protein YgfZ [Steroidobacteraceae bacterium]
MDNSQLLYGHCQLDDLGVLAVRGRDASVFLQGQLSQDMTRLAPGRASFAGCHTPQGRVLAVLRLLVADDGYHCILPTDLVEPLAAHLRKYILRAKVTLTDERGTLRVIGEAQGEARTLRVATPGDGGSIAHAAWRRQDIAAGLPQVYRATSEVFVAQMLNLDCVAGIAFDKGCYTGQEIIARAHYRGRVKRRMQRFRTTARPPAPLVPGVAGTLADGRPFQVVDAVSLEDGRVEFLAVAPLVVAPPTPAPVEAGAAPIEAETLPLPYALPD